MRKYWIPLTTLLITAALAVTTESLVSQEPRPKSKPLMSISSQPMEGSDASLGNSDLGSLDDVVDSDENNSFDESYEEDVSEPSLEDQARSLAGVLSKDGCINYNNFEFVQGQLIAAVEDLGSKKAESLYSLIVENLDITPDCWGDNLLAIFSLTEVFHPGDRLKLYFDHLSDEDGFVPDNIGLDETMVNLFDALSSEERARNIARVCEDKAYVFEWDVDSLLDGDKPQSFDDYSNSLCRQLLQRYSNEFMDAVSYANDDSIASRCFDLAEGYREYEGLRIELNNLWDQQCPNDDDFDLNVYIEFRREYSNLYAKYGAAEEEFFLDLVNLAEEIKSGDSSVPFIPVIRALYQTAANAAGVITEAKGVGFQNGMLDPLLDRGYELEEIFGDI
jgi:hypothetical protein